MNLIVSLIFFYVNNSVSVKELSDDSCLRKFDFLIQIFT